VAVGCNALQNITTGADHVVIGEAAGSSITTSEDSVIIGQAANASSGTANNEIAIGQGCNAQGANTATIGNTSCTAWLPADDNGVNLGASDRRFANLYVADMQMNNEGTGGNVVDGTEGSWTIQEGEDDLFLLNRKNGKKYKFKLEAV
jgi:hypothetical protein